jgi:hypothetical protein
MNADEWIDFEEQPIPPERKTRIVTVRNRRSKTALGELKWYGPWRQYCFFPQSYTIFNVTCMARIAREVREMTEGHRAKA